MKKLAIAAIACAMPLTATAKGWGFTHHNATGYSTFGQLDDNDNVVGEGMPAYYSGFHGLPSLDIRQGGWVFQLDVLNLVHGVLSNETDAEGDAAKSLHLGVNGYKTTQKHPIREDGLGGVIQPGFSLDIDSNSAFDPLRFDAQAQMRLGARTQQPDGMGVGIYVVPGVGIANGEDWTEADEDKMFVSVSGSLQISVWRNTGK